MKLDSSEITHCNPYTYLALPASPPFHPVMSFLSVDNTMLHITFHRHPATYEVFGRYRKCVFTETPHFPFGPAPSVSKALPQHYPLAAPTNRFSKAVVLSILCLDKHLRCVDVR